MQDLILVATLFGPLFAAAGLVPTTRIPALGEATQVRLGGDQRGRRGFRVERGALLSARPGRLPGRGLARGLHLGGGTLRIVSSAGDEFDDTYELAAERWSYQKQEGQDKGYKFRPTKPFKSINVQPGKGIKVVANGEGLGHTLLTQPDAVDVVLTLGAHCYCLRFGDDALGGDVTFKPDKKFLAKNTRAPSGCPVAASPGDAFVEGTQVARDVRRH